MRLHRSPGFSEPSLFAYGISTETGIIFLERGFIRIKVGGGVALLILSHFS